ncbi:hypothetical protein NM208_g6253 [Fusarium decemcellulare]|uniref:Uncharacterized protein n=1 Tax=Fusarium decemcellulare TaxID=57161 RepID=A0ACC1SDS7_9HYPO|nr:hypothetical protein NM208_g6253 [Fusarium decemcellulare]
MWPGLFRAIDGNIETGIARCGKWAARAHYNMVRGMVPKERLLEWSVEDGWEPLCEFLDKPVPDEPFPHENAAVGWAGQEMKLGKRYIMGAIKNLAILGAVGTAIGGGPAVVKTEWPDRFANHVLKALGNQNSNRNPAYGLSIYIIDFSLQQSQNLSAVAVHDKIESPINCGPFIALDTMGIRKKWHKLVGSLGPTEVSDREAPGSSQIPPPDDQQSPPPATDNRTLPLENTTVQSQVWNDAYDSVKAEDPGVVDAYERILSGQLTSGVAAISVEGYPDNLLGTAEDRRDKMAKLIEAGQSKTERGTNIKEKINDAVQPFNQLRSTISSIVKADPTASTAWTGITAVLDILASPLSEPGANRDGIKYILERAQWYWNLSALVLDEDKIDRSMKELQNSLKKSISKLYEKLLLYQMQSVCLYSRSEVATILRDLVKLDDWKGKIESIEKEALRVKDNVRQLRDEDTSTRLRNLDICLEGVRTDLQTIASAIRDVGSQQHKLHEEEKDKAFLNQLHDVDPSSEKTAIETLKGGMVKKAHDLVLEHSNFEKLQRDDAPGILWVTGNPGSGKTMFLCGIVDRLVKRPEYGVVSYFFCRADRLQTRTAKAVLRGLLWLICTQSWGLTRRLREEYENKTKSLVEDDDTVVSVTLKKMLGKALSAPSMSRAVLIVDAIDECDKQSITTLLRTIGQLSHEYPAQWIMSTRTSEIYRSSLLFDAPVVEPSYLKLSEEVISKAVVAFVKYSVKRLSQINHYDDGLEDRVEKTLCSKAGDTFLWVALVCLELQGLGPGTRHVEKALEKMPQGLNKLYERMFHGAIESVDGESCRQILRLVCVTNRPLALDELQTLVPGLEGLPNKELRAVVANCGSFLSLQGHENDRAIATFVHESAREYLTETAQSETFPDGITHQHQLVLRRALSNIKTLTRNVYQLPSLGTAVDEVKKPEPDPLSRLCYSCHHWLDHANHIQQQEKWETSDNAVLEDFICHDLLHWIEMLSLTSNMAQGTAAFQRFSKSCEASFSSDSHQTTKLVREAHRFILYNKSCIEYAPLQVYASALLFCPQQSMGEIKSRYQHQLQGVTAHPQSESDRATFSRLFQNLPVPRCPLRMSFAPDGNLLATVYYTGVLYRSAEYFLEVWDILASHRILSVQVQQRVYALAFSNDGTQVFAALWDGSVNRFAVQSGNFIGGTGFTYLCPIERAYFSPNARTTAVQSGESFLILDSNTGEEVCQMIGVLQLRFSPDSLQMATLLRGRSRVSLWSIGNSESSLTISLEAEVEDMAWFGFDKVAVRSSRDRTISVYSTEDGSKILSVSSHAAAKSMAWLGTGMSYLCHCGDGTMRIYDDTGMNCVQTFPALQWDESSVEDALDTYAFSAVSHLLALAGMNGVKIWDLNMQVGSVPQTQTSPETWEDSMPNMTFSPSRGSSSLLAFTSPRGAGIRTVQHGEVANISILPVEYFATPVFSPNGQTVAYHSSRRLQVWNTVNSTASRERRFKAIWDLTFSHDGTSLAVARGACVSLLDLATLEIKGTISVDALKVVYSHDDRLLAIVDLNSVYVWSVSPVQDLHHLYSYWLADESGNVLLVDFSPSDEWLAIVTFHGYSYEADYESVLIWRLGESKPRFEIPWHTGRIANSRWKSLAISSDGNLIAVALDHCVWVWNLRLPVTSRPLTIELSYKTRKCSFDAENVRLLVDGGIILINLDLHHLEYRGYGLSEDCAWITEDNQKVLYLTQDFRPRRPAKDRAYDSVAFMDSTVAIQNESGHIQIVRFHNNSGFIDSRWTK